MVLGIAFTSFVDKQTGLPRTVVQNQRISAWPPKLNVQEYS